MGLFAVLRERFRPQAADTRDAATDYYKACLDGDTGAANTLASNNVIHPSTIRHGLLRLFERKKYDDIDFLMKKGEAAADPDFVGQILAHGDPGPDMGKRLDILDRNGARYGSSEFCTLILRAHSDPDPAMRMAKSPLFNVRDNDSISLLYAATSRHHDIFDALMAKGANPSDALFSARNDLRYDAGREMLRQWAGEFYARRPGTGPTP